jgi:signal transduction histidine kinase
MEPLNNVVVVWTLIAAMSLLLAVAHSARWILDRQARADLAFAVVALSFVCIVIIELEAMHAGSPAEWGRWLRWYHVPLFGLNVGLAAFIHFYLGSVRAWLGWSHVATRVAILALNFASPVSFNFEQVGALDRVSFLGESVVVIGEAVTNSWQWLGLFSSMLLLALVVDAAVTAWRRGNAAEQRRAAIVGGSLVLFVLLATAYSQLVIWQVAAWPVVLAPTFLIPLFALSYDLVRGMLRAARLARELQESQRLLELAVSAAGLGFGEWDSHTDHIWATRAAREIFGVLPGQGADRYAQWLARIHADDASRVAQEMQLALGSGADFAVEFRVCPPQREPRWVSAIGRVELSDAGTAVVRGVVWDISDRRREQDEAARLRHELAHSGRVSMLGQLASSLAHELSQPLGAILRNAEVAELLLQSPHLDVEELKAIVIDIHRDDRRAGEVIDRLRTLLKRKELDLQPVLVESLISDVTTLIRGDAAARHVSVVSVIGPGVPIILADRVHLSQVLLNLIINAMDAVMDRPVPDRKVKLSGQAAGTDMVEISVSDSGPGIPAEVLPRLFDPFFTTKESGMGMGLAISRAIVDAHGGRLTAENNAEGGATFRILFPAWQTAAA